MIVDGSVVRVQFIWEWPGRRYCRCVFHWSAADQTGAGGDLLQAAIDTLGTSSPSLAACLADDVVLLGSRAEFVYPLPSPDPPVNYLNPLGPYTGLGLPWLQNWGTRVLWRTGAVRARYDPWTILPFFPASQLIDPSVARPSSSWVSLVDSLITSLLTPVLVVGPSPGDSITLRLCSWNRQSTASSEIVAGVVADRLFSLRRRNWNWIDRPWP